MKPSLLFPAILAALTFSVELTAQPTKVWSHGNPSNEEQYALEVVNRVRVDPTAAAEFYITASAANPDLKKIVDAIRYRENGKSPVSGAEAVRLMMAQAIPVGQDAPPRWPLAFYPLFNEQAKAQGQALLNGTANDASTFPSFDSSASGYFFTVPSSGQVPFFKAIAKIPISTPSLVGSNATGGSATIRGGFAPGGGPQNFSRGQSVSIVNLYNSNIGLRESFLNSVYSFFSSFLPDNNYVYEVNSSGTFIFHGKTKFIGLSLSTTRTSNPGAGSKIMSVFMTDNEAFTVSDIPYGNTETVFITGVAYEDKDKDGDYTAGEGIADVKITPNSGEWYAVTSASGGYAIP